MKTKELISKMNEIAGATTISSKGIHIYNLDRELVGWVDADEFGSVDTSYKSLDDMKNKEEVVKFLFEYALTPLSERDNQPKFRVRMLPGKINYDAYLNQVKQSKNIFLNDSDEDDDTQTIFTNSEYDKLQHKYPEWLPKFDEKDPHFEFLVTNK